MSTPTSHHPRPRPFALLRRASALAQAQADRLAREEGLTMQQWELLMRLRHAPAPLDQRALGCAMAVTPPTVTALVDAAEERGLVRREPHPQDRRRRLVALTDAGQAALTRAPHLGREVGRRMTRGFTDEERALLADLLERCAGNLRDGSP
jgi:DNA-binding MarR family transcriptional regulator